MTRHDDSLAGAYAEALRGFLAGGGEGGLARAHELGRAALEHGLGILEIAGIHYVASERLALERGGGGGGDGTARRARAHAFFLESLAPFEMTHRGFKDAVAVFHRVNETMEAEARRIAHALHDETSQGLAAACIALGTLDHDLPEPVRRRLETVGETLRDTAERLRMISHELRPTLLDDLGLVPALEFLAEGIARGTDLVTVIEGDTDGRLPVPIETALYRVAQEAIANAIRHGKARRIAIRIARTGSSLLCSIQDDGAGFAPPPPGTRGSPSGGLGLVGMRERVHALGGTIAVESAPSRGATIRIALPVEARRAVANPSR